MGSEGTRCIEKDASVHDWFQYNLNGHHRDAGWPEKFAIILWYIWKWRCKACFDNNADVPGDRGAFLVARIHDIRTAMEQGVYELTDTSTNLHMTWIKWTPPSAGWKVLNIDGAVMDTQGRVGAGGVIRDEAAKWIVGFSEYLGACSVLKAEVRALLRGLKIAQELGVTKLWIYTDSSTLISMITNPSTWKTEVSPLIHQCVQLLVWPGWETQVSHCFREINQVADKLAKLGLNMSLGVSIYREPPLEVQGALHDDSRGVLWPRMLKH